jgi:hypothetical protein
MLIKLSTLVSENVYSDARTLILTNYDCGKAINNASKESLEKYEKELNNDSHDEQVKILTEVKKFLAAFSFNFKLISNGNKVASKFAVSDDVFNQLMEVFKQMVSKETEHTGNWEKRAQTTSDEIAQGAKNLEDVIDQLNKLGTLKYGYDEERKSKNGATKLYLNFVSWKKHNLSEDQIKNGE